MPCQDYFIQIKPNKNKNKGSKENEGFFDLIKMKKHTDKLARIACKAMTELEKKGLIKNLMKDPEVKRWWIQHKKDDKKAMTAAKKTKKSSS